MTFNTATVYGTEGLVIETLGAHLPDSCLNRLPQEEADRLAFATVRVVFYHMNMESRDPNGLLLHVPTRVPLTEANIIELENKRDWGFLTDVLDHLSPKSRGEMPLSLGAPMTFGGPRIMNFLHFSLVSARNAKEIPEALARVRSDRRPTLSSELARFAQNALGEDHSFIMSCMPASSSGKTPPIIYWYEVDQENDEGIVFPGLDAHTGGAPVLTGRHSQVHRDHSLAAGVLGQEGRKVPERFLPDELLFLFSGVGFSEATSFPPGTQTANGDFFHTPSGWHSRLPRNVAAIL